MSYKQYAIVAPGGTDLQCQEKNLSHTIANEIPPRGVLVRVHYAGVCHTDLHQWLEGGYRLSDDEVMLFAGRDDFKYTYPHVPGHEISGTIYEFGKDVKDSQECTLVKGDRVCVYPWIGCMNCSTCISGRDDYCTGTSTGHEIGFNLDGGYSEYIIVPHYRYLLPVPENIKMDLAAILGCSSLTAYNAVKTAIEVIPSPLQIDHDSHVAIIGLGGVGQWALSFIPVLLPGIKITGIDVQQSKLNTLLQAGLIQNSFLLAQTSPTQEQVLNCCQSISSKFKLVIDFVNNPLTFDLSVRLLGNGGTLIAVGLFGGTGSLQLPLLALGRKRIVGIQTGSLEYFKEVMTFLNTNIDIVKPPTLINYSFDDCGQALKDLRDGKIPGRAILKIVSD